MYVENKEVGDNNLILIEIHFYLMNSVSRTLVSLSFRIFIIIQLFYGLYQTICF